MDMSMVGQPPPPPPFHPHPPNGAILIDIPGKRQARPVAPRLPIGVQGEEMQEISSCHGVSLWPSPCVDVHCLHGWT